MDRQEFVAAVREMHESAGDYVRAYASLHAPNVGALFVNAIVAALGDISIAEAIGALDRIERGES
jgi:hypothetical protein